MLGSEGGQQGRLQPVADFFALPHQPGVVDQHGGALTERSCQTTVIGGHDSLSVVGKHTCPEHPSASAQRNDDPAAEVHALQRRSMLVVSGDLLDEGSGIVPRHFLTCS